LRAGLRERGYVEGGNTLIEYRWADTPTQLTEFAAELVRRQIAVIVTAGNSAAHAAKTATASIPIVFVVADDPVRLGFVAHFSRRGGNRPGLTLISGALGARRMELLRELVPNASIIGVLTTPNTPAASDLREEQRAARDFGQRMLVMNASTAAEIEPAVAA